MVSKILYKYRSWQQNDVFLAEESKFQKRLLKNSEIYFSNPKDFNDPFDLSIPKRYDKLSIHEKYNTLEFIIKKKKPNDSPLEIHNKVSNQLKNGHLFDEQYLQNANNKSIDYFSNAHGIFSVAKKPDNILMWSHYSDSHRGYCIGLDSYKLSEYLEDNKTNSDYYYDLCEVFYSNRYPIIKPTINFEQNLINNLERLITKAKLWNYEKEFRYILTGTTSKAFKIDPIIYKEIIFGCKMDFNSKEEINNILNKFYPHIKRFRAEQDNEKFQLNLIRE